MRSNILFSFLLPFSSLSSPPLLCLSLPFSSLPSLSLFIPLSFCRHVNVSVWCTCLCTYMKSSKKELGVIVYWILPCSLKVCHFGRGCWTVSSQESVPASQSWGYWYANYARALPECQRSELRCSCPHSKCFYSRSHFPRSTHCISFCFLKPQRNWRS